MRRIVIACAGALAAAAAPAGAAPLIFSGVIQGELGYGTNPFLVNGENKGAGYGAISLQPTLTKTTERSSTTLSGSYYRQQYFGDYGHSDTIIGTLSRTQQLTEHLNGNLQASYTSTENAILSPGFDPAIVDVLTTGQRSRLALVSGGLGWQATARDSFTASANYSHGSYGSGSRFLSSDFDNYGGQFGYLHAVSARTKLGFQVAVSELHSQNYPSSSSISPALSIQQILSPIWTFNGNVGIIRQHVSGPYSANSTGVGFSANICGKYPRHQLCATASRQSSASGFGGLRTDLTAVVTYTSQLTEHSSLSFSGSYDDSTGKDYSTLTVFNVPNQRIFQARVDYSRTLTRRLSAGASLRGQWRDYSSFGSAHAIGGSVNLSYRVGRI